MFKAGNKESSPAASVTPTSVASSCLSSHAATLRVTSEGLNIVGEGGVLGKGKDSGSPDQKQKFFATRSTDGSWNLLMSKASDPSRLFLVRPAPGHRFQMTGGKVRMESADTAGESKSANGSSSTNGVEEDLLSHLSTPESADQSPGTSKSVSVPVAQLRASSSISTSLSSSSAHTASAVASPSNAETATASAEAVKPSDPPEPKRPSFFKSRTAKDREALKASAQHVVGKKVLFTNRKGSKSSGGTQAGHRLSKQLKKSKSTAGAAKSHKNASPFLSSHEQSNAVPTELASSDRLPLSSLATTTESPSLTSSTSVTHSSSMSSVSPGSGKVASVFEWLSPSSLLGNTVSGMPKHDSSCSSDPPVTLTSQTPRASRSRNSCSGDQDLHSTTVGDTETKTCDQQSKVVGEDGTPFNAGVAGGDDKEDCVDNFDSSTEELLDAEYSETKKSSECRGGSGQTAEDSDSDVRIYLQSPLQLENQVECSKDDSQMGRSPGANIDDSLAGTNGKTSKEKTTVEFQNDESERDGAATVVLEADAVGKMDEAVKDVEQLDAVEKLTGKTQKKTERKDRFDTQKKTERKDRFDFSSDTDDYEFLFSDTEKDTTTEDVAHNSSVARHALEPPTSRGSLMTLPKHPSARGDLFGVEESRKDSTKRKDTVTETEQECTKLIDDTNCATPSLNLETDARQPCREHPSDAERQSSQSKKTINGTEMVVNMCVNEDLIEESQGCSEEGVCFESDSTGKENDQIIRSREKANHRLSEEKPAGGLGDQSLLCNQSAETSSVGDSNILNPEASTHAQENGLLANISAHEQLPMRRKRKKRKSELDTLIGQESDILALELSEQEPIGSNGNDLKNAENKEKKRKKRKSELENLVEIVENERDTEQKNVVETLAAEMQRLDGQEQVRVDAEDVTAEMKGLDGQEQVRVDVEDEDQEPVSKTVPTSVLQSTRQDEVTHKIVEKQKKTKKRKIKLCINFNPGSISGDSTNTERQPSTRPMDTTESSEPPSDKGSMPPKVDSQCLPLTEQELSHNKQRNPDELASTSEYQDTNAESSQEPNRESVTELEMFGVSIKKPKKNKKKKKLKIVFGSSGEVSTTDIPVSVNLDSVSLNTSEDRREDYVTDVLDVPQPDLDVIRNQTALYDGAQKRKKRKKRLSELETLIHDQEAYASSMGAMEEATEQSKEGTYDTHHDSETPETDKDKTQSEVMESSQSQEQQSSEENGLEVSSERSGQAAQPTSVDAVEAPGSGSPSVDILHTASRQQPESVSNPTPKQGKDRKKDALYTAKSKVDKAKKKQKRKKLAQAGVIIMPPVTVGGDLLPVTSGIDMSQETTGTTEDDMPLVTPGKNKAKKKKKKKQTITSGVIAMPPVTSGINMPPVTAGNDMPPVTAGNDMPPVTAGNDMPPVTSGSDTDAMLMDNTGMESTENEDLNCSVSTETSIPAEHGSKGLSSDDEDEEARANRELKKYLTQRSFGKWELARMFGTPFVVLERLSEQDVYFMSRRFRNARVTGRARCSDHCRLRTLGYLCELNLIKCKPPQVQRTPGETAAEVSLKKKKRKRKNKEGSEQDGEGKKKKKRRKGKDGDADIIFMSDSSLKTSASSGSQENRTPTSAASVLPSFPSATIGRIRISQPAARLVVPSSQAITSPGPRLITVPPIAVSRPPTLPQLYTIPSLGTAGRPSNMPQVITIASLGAAISSANKILIPPLLMKSTASSLRDATRASLTQAISNSLCKTRPVTPVSVTPVVASAPGISAHSAALLPKGPLVVQAAPTSQASMLPKSILVQASASSLSAPVLPKGPIMVQTSIASSTAAPSASSLAVPKQFIVVQMGDKRVLVPTSALSTVTSPTPTILSSSVPHASTTVTSSSRPLLQSAVGAFHSTASPVSTIIAAPTPGIRQPSSLIPGSVARIVLSNRRPATVAAPRIGPTASGLLFANRAATRPNQAWSGPRSTLDNQRRVMVTPGSQPQGVRVVLSGAGSLSSGTRFTVSSSPGGVFVTSRQAGNMVRVASPRQTRPGKKVMTEEERLRKRARLEKKYPLPPGVVIKTESVSRGYSDEGKTTQANSTSRVFLSTVPVGTAGRGQVNLSQPIPVLSAFRGSPIVIRQALPATSAIPRSSALLGPLIIRMPNVSVPASTINTSSASASTSAVTVMTASSLLSSLTRTSSTTTTATLPLTYSLLTGSAGAASIPVSSTGVAVTCSTSLASPPPPQTFSVRSSVSRAPVASVSSASSGAVSSGSGEAAGARQQNNNEDDAIYIADSPQPEVQTSEADSVPVSKSQASAVGSGVSVSTTCSVTVSSASSSVATTSVYTSQSPVMLTSSLPSTLPSTSLSTSSSRMASLGAMWVRQATESPDSMPSIDASSLQSERMQRLKEFLAKQMGKGGMADERRQQALGRLHQQFFQTAASSKNVPGGCSQRVDDTTSNSEDSSANDPDHQVTEVAETEGRRVENDQDRENNVAAIEGEHSVSSSEESLVTEDCSERRETRERGEDATDSVVIDADQDSSEKRDSCVDILSPQETLETGERVSDADRSDADSTDDVMLLLDADQGAVGVAGPVSSQVNSVFDPSRGLSGEPSCEEPMEVDDEDSAEDAQADEGDTNRPSDSCSTSSVENDGGDGPLQVTSDSEKDLPESSSQGTGQSGTAVISSDGDESAGHSSDSPTDAS